jgi:hypothetical protein
MFEYAYNTSAQDHKIKAGDQTQISSFMILGPLVDIKKLMSSPDN